MSLFLTTAYAEEAEASNPSWFHDVFRKFSELPAWGYILIVVMLAASIVYFVTNKGKKTVWTTQMLSVGAMCMALTVVLSRIRLFTMPNGGSVTPASMLPLILFAYIYGVGPGLLLGALYGILDYLFGGWFLNVLQFIFDYPLAFAMLGLAGLFRNMSDQKAGLALGAFVASLGRYIAAVLAGVFFWADGRTGLEAWTYSFAYNGSYMAIECVLCVVIAILIGERILKSIKRFK